MKKTMELSNLGLKKMSTQEIATISGGGIKEQLIGYAVGKALDILSEYIKTHPMPTPPPNPHVCDNV
jgi:hypothetical protein